MVSQKVNLSASRLHTCRTGDFVSIQVPKDINAGVYSPRRINRLNKKTRVGVKDNDGNNFLFQAKYVTARVFTADGYGYGFLKAPESRVLAS